ncbi:tRNA dimethylallyltransferase [compost metagenome]
MQIYKEMDIGTAKPSKEEMDNIRHYLIDFVSPCTRYSVADFKKDAENAIEQILENNKIPIIVGGTGLYIDSLIYGIEYSEFQLDQKFREELEIRVENEGLDKIYQEAKQIDPIAIEKISENDKKRILRILEIYKATGKTKTEQEIESRLKGVKYDYHVYAINMDREKLYERINVRVDKMIENGLIKEVEDLVGRYDEFPTSMQGLGYKEVLEYIKGRTSKQDMIEKIKQETRRYAKRQLTWFRKNKETIWIDGLNDRQNNLNIILEGMNIEGKENKS